MSEVRSPAEKQSRQRIILELATLLLLIIVTGFAFRDAIYPALGIPDHAPIPARPLFAFLLAWFFLRRSNMRWRDLGLCVPTSWFRALACAIGLYLALFANSRFVMPVVAQWFEATSTPSIVADVPGNFPLLLGWLAIAVGIGGVVEELFFRGFLMTRIAALFSSRPLGIVFAILAQAVLFGALHLYAGSRGFAFAFLSALLFGVAYLASGRNLWPLIAVHSYWNSSGLISLYLSEPQ